MQLDDAQRSDMTTTNEDLSINGNGGLLYMVGAFPIVVCLILFDVFSGIDNETLVYMRYWKSTQISLLQDEQFGLFFSYQISHDVILESNDIRTYQ